MVRRTGSAEVEPSDSEVREHLVHVLQSPSFRTAKRCQNFLRFIVEQKLDGKTDNLRERIIGIEVFGRSTYEPAEETIVRVTATDIRKRLAQYYQEAAPDGIRIDLTPGTYTPLFTRQLSKLTVPDGEPAVGVDVQSAEVDPLPFHPAVPPSKSRHNFWLFSGAAFVVAVLATILTWQFWDSNPLTEFWQPVLAAPHPALVWLGSGSSYLLSSRIREELARAPKDKPIQMQIDPNEVTHVTQQVSVGHVRGLLNVMLLLQRLGKPGEYRFDDPISIPELVGRPIVLVGSFNNRWAMSLNSQFRFRFGRTEQPDGKVILSVDDTQDAKTRWLLPPIRSINDATGDYAIITRTFSPETKQVVISAGGIFHFGTDAAAQFITNPACWLELARHAPRGWQKKNLQVVLKTDILRGSPGRPQIVATHFW